MKKLIFTAGTVLFAIYSHAQTKADKNDAFIFYKKSTSIADSLFYKKEYSKSVPYYSSAFKRWGKGWQWHRYKAAICYSVLNEPDSAFYQLIRVVEKTEYLNCDSLNKQELYKLKTDIRWSHLNNLLCEGSNVELGQLMLKIWNDDQVYRYGIDSIGKKYGYVSPQMNERWAKLHIVDSIDLIQIDSIYSIYGWPGPELVSKKGNQAFYLVIEHSSLAVQERYLPIMQKAVKEGKATMHNLVYLEDRILMRRGVPQKYGTQFVIRKDGVQRLFKLQDKENVNVIRDSVGLSPLTQIEIMNEDTILH